MNHTIELRLDEIEYLINVLEAEVATVTSLINGAVPTADMTGYEDERELAKGIIKKLH